MPDESRNISWTGRRADGMWPIPMAKSPEHVWDLGFLVAWRAHTWYGRGAGGWWVRGGPIFVVGNVERVRKLVSECE